MSAPTAAAAAAAAAASSSSATAATATANAATPLPASIQSYLDWGHQRLHAVGLSDGGVARGSAVVPGAPLCAARAVAGEGCGLVLTRDLPAGSHLLFRAPGSMQFRAEHSAVAPLLPGPASESLAWIRMALALLYERHLGAASPWAPFIRAMPQRNDQPMFWSERQLSQLKGCTFLPHIHFFDFDREYESKVLPWLAANGAKAGGMNPRNCSVEDFCLVNGWMISRAFRPKCAPHMGPVMLPLVDLLNTTSLQLEDDGTGFHRRINTAVEWVPGGEKGDDLDDPTLLIRTLPSAGALRQGQQLYLPYGSSSLGNSDLLIRYGFTEGRDLHTDNPHDVVSIDARRIVELLEGADDAQGEARALTNPAEANEEEEAQALHQKHKDQRRNKAKAKGADAAAAAAANSNGAVKAVSADADGDDAGSDSDSCGSAASGDLSSLHAHLDLASRLPFESFQLPADGSLPDPLLRFVAVLLGREDADSFLRACEADAEKQREEAKKDMQHQQASKDNDDTATSAATDSAAAGASSSSAAAAAASPSPPALSNLSFGWSGDSASASSSAPASACLSSADVLESLFFVFHHLLGCYASTLEDDVKLLDYFTRQRGGSSSGAAAAPASEDSVRMELALHARMSEKRILYRALEQVKRRLAELAAAMDDGQDDEDEGSEGEGDGEGSGRVRVDPSAAVAAAMGNEDESDTDLAADHPDPNILSPSLYRMLSAQKRQQPAQKDEDEEGEGEGAEEEGEDAETAPTLRFTYTKSAHARPAKKKRRA